MVHLFLLPITCRMMLGIESLSSSQHGRLSSVRFVGYGTLILIRAAVQECLVTHFPNWMINILLFVDIYLNSREEGRLRL